MAQTRNFNVRQDNTIKFFFQESPTVTADTANNNKADSVTTVHEPLHSCIDPYQIAVNVASIKTSAMPSNLTSTTRAEDANSYIIRPTMQMKKKNITRNITPTKRNAHGSFIKTLNRKGRKFIKSRGLSKSQQHIVQRIFHYFNDIDHALKQEGIKNLTPQQIHERGIATELILLTGQPGSGKSYVIETVAELCQKIGVGHVTSTSYNGIAAVNVDGNTMSTTFSINDTSDAKVKIRLSDKTIMDIFSKLDAETLRLLIVDEVSAIDARLLGLLDYRLQQLMNNDLPFGGIMVLLAGDFNQLGPVLKQFLPTTMMTYAQRLKNLNQLQNPETPTITNDEQVADEPKKREKT
jgi:tRNA uridine 5-carbamoylmethylation protein Kti12